MKIINLVLILAFPFLLSAYLKAQTLPLPYYTGFDSPAEQTGWQEFRLGVIGTYPWSYTNGQSVSAPTSLFHDFYLSGSSTDTVIDWFVSPQLNNLTASSTHVSLKIKISAFAGVLPADYFGIWVSNSNDPNPATGSFTELANLTNMQPQNQWLDTTINMGGFGLGPYTGYLALKYKGNNNWFTIGIDNINITSANSTNELSNSSGISVFPNPSNGKFQFSSSKIQIQSLEVYNIMGEKVYSEWKPSAQASIPNLHTLVDLRLQPSGVYFLNIKTDKESYTQKLIIQK